MVGFPFVVLAFAGSGDAPERSGGEVTFESLLAEMVDRDALARWPEPAYVTRQASSYDRRSTTPSDATENGWFANQDNMEGSPEAWRWVEHEGRHECRLVDVDGPGALVRFWSGGKPPEGTIRFYVDGASEPALAGAMATLLSGAGPIPAPLAVKTSGDALDLYMPLPFARHLEITYDEGAPPSPPPLRWFNAEYRVYPTGTSVRSFTANALSRARAAIEATAQRLDHVDDGTEMTDGESKDGSKDESKLEDGDAANLGPGDRLVLDFHHGPQAVRAIALELLRGDSPRDLVVTAVFDGELCVWCPASEFFGGGPRLVPLKTWARTVRTGDDLLLARFTMPWRESASVAVENVGSRELAVALNVSGGAWTWDDRSLHFHSTWRNDPSVPTRPLRDWNYVTIGGRGVYVGDTLTVMNPTEAWWGEGDEKVFVDGESFPSHFGTGSEDCYGYAWGSPATFHAPFCAQPRCDGPGNLGFTTVARTRALDAIPFTSSLQYDLEVWHWADCAMSYSVASFWYARPGATSNRAADPKGAAMALRAPGLFRAVECERAEVTASSIGLAISKQSSLAFSSGRWSCDAQLFVQAKTVGDFVELRLAKGLEGPRRLKLHLTTSYDYGVLRVSVNGTQAAADLDAWSEQSDLGPAVDLGVHAPRGGELYLRVEVVGHHPRSQGSGCYFGLDAVELVAE